MAKIRVTIKGTLGQMSASHFLTVIDHSLHLLKDLDRHFSESRMGSLSWVVSGLGQGNSGYIDLDSRAIRGREDLGAKVRDAFISGIDTIEKERTIPRLFTTAMLERVHKMTREFGRNGVEGVYYSDEDPTKQAILSTEAEKTLEDLLGVKYKAIGSAEGKIELLSVRQRARRFDIYEPRTDKAVRCNFPTDIEQDVFRAAEKRRRVVVFGTISYNARSEPISILVSPPIRFLKKEEELPSIEDIRGLDITNGMTTKDYIKSLTE